MVRDYVCLCSISDDRDASDRRVAGQGGALAIEDAVSWTNRLLKEKGISKALENRSEERLPCRGLRKLSHLRCGIRCYR